MQIDFRATVAALSRPAFILDRQWRFVCVNSLAEACVGSREHELIGRTLWESFPMLLDTEIETRYRHCMHVRERVAFEIPWSVPAIRLRIVLSPLGDGLLVEYDDITESRRVQDELRFRATLLDAVGQAVIFSDRDYIVRYWNRAAEERYGFTAQEAIGRHIAELTPSQLTRDEVEAILGSVRGGAPWSGALRIRRRSGAEVPVWVTLSAVCGADGTFGIVGVSHDLRDTDRAEQALRASERRYRSLLDHAADGIVVNSIQDKRFVEVNTRYCEIIGYTRDEVLRLDPAAVLHPDDLAGLETRLQQLVAGRTLFDQRRLRHKDGHFVDVEVTSRIIDGQLQSIVRDVTDRNALEAQLRQAQRMESLGLLAGGVAHDFNNLLTVILSCCVVLESRLPRRSSLRAELGEIQGAAERAAALTRQLLAIGRQQRLKVETVDLSELVGNMVPLLTRVIEKDIAIVTTLERDALVRTDRSQIEQVILNLAVNARDAMPKGGQLNIEVRAGTTIRLVVADTGHGMSGEIRSRIFEPFFTTKGPGRGTGLGLSTVYGIVKQSGGSITCESEPDRGTKFTVELPRILDGAAARGASSPSTEHAHRPFSVLLVEDEPGVRRVVRTVLESAGHVVEEAANAEDAIELCRAERDFDVLITDIVMPGMNGRALANQLTKTMPKLRVLHISGYAKDELRDGLLKSSARLLMKPFTPAQLIEAVDALEG